MYPFNNQYSLSRKVTKDLSKYKSLITTRVAFTFHIFARVLKHKVNYPHYHQHQNQFAFTIFHLCCLSRLMKNHLRRSESINSSQIDRNNTHLRVRRRERSIECVSYLIFFN